MNTPTRMVDAHHHLWDLTALHYPWLMERGVKRFFGDPAPIQKNYLVSDFRAEFGALPVEKSVHIQVGVAEENAVGETLWVDRQARAYGLPHAIVAFCDLTRPDRDAVLDAHSEATRLRGVRQIISRSAAEDAQTGTAGLLDSSDFLQGLRALAARGLSFDLQLTPPHLPKAAEVFAQVPELKVALCHAGSLYDRSTEGVGAWRAGLAQLAQLPNVLCKISGLGMFEPDWTPASVRDRVRMAIDVFSPERVAFGSNFPVDKLTASYRDTWGAHLEITADFSAADRDAMFCTNAEAFYRI